MDAQLAAWRRTFTLNVFSSIGRARRHGRGGGARACLIRQELAARAIGHRIARGRILGIAGRGQQKAQRDFSAGSSETAFAIES